MNAKPTANLDSDSISHLKTEAGATQASGPTDRRTHAGLEAALARSWPLVRWRDLTVVVGVSGGADSVALIRALHALWRTQPSSTGQLVIAHYNHGLRGLSSDQDARFVQELAQQLGVACEVGGSHFASSPEMTSQPPRDENRLRQRRLDFLLETAHRYGARYLALAHTSNDQNETILHRLIRGTGLTGLTGIPRVRRLSAATTLIRPMLSISRVQVIRYLQSLRQPFRHDHSNDDPRYTRNRLRHELLPLLASHYNPRIGTAIARLAAQARAIESLVEPLTEALFERSIRLTSPTEIVIDSTELRDQPEYLVAELFVRIWSRHDWPAQAMTATHWRSLVRLARQAARDADLSVRDDGPPRHHRLRLDLPGPIHVQAIGRGEIRLSWRAGRTRERSQESS
jgi:tRNA(Ile)-lysidine synthase